MSSSYCEWIENDIQYRKYLSDFNFFSVTSETFFDKLLLEDLTESVFTCSSRFSRWVEKYNRTSAKKVAPSLLERPTLVCQRVFPCWLLYVISKRVEVMFPVSRTIDRSIEIETVCGFLYPSLKKVVDSKWLKHSCSKCSSGVVVLGRLFKIYLANIGNLILLWIIISSI